MPATERRWGQERRSRQRRKLDYALEQHVQTDYHEQERRNKAWWSDKDAPRQQIRREIDRRILEALHNPTSIWIEVMKGRRSSRQDGDWVTTDGWQIASLNLPDRGSGRDQHR